MICRFVGEKMSLIFTRRAQNLDVDKIVQILDDAIAFLKKSGSSQWQNGYPNRKTVEEDIKNKVAWVLTVDNEVAGYAAVVIGNEPTYADIEGKWKNNVDTYATIHRIAVSSKFRGMHLSQFFLSNIISLTYAHGIHIPCGLFFALFINQASRISKSLNRDLRQPFDQVIQQCCYKLYQTSFG